MTPYSVFIEAFLDKIEDYRMYAKTDEDNSKYTIRLMKSACGRFSSVCLKNILSWDDSTESFIENVGDYDIVDIVSEGMLAAWLKPFVNNSDDFYNVLNTKDFSMYSPGNLIDKKSNLYNTAEKRFQDMMNEYSYTHGDLSTLHC